MVHNGAGTIVRRCLESVLQQVGGKAQVAHLVPEMDFTPKSTPWGMRLGAQQPPADAGGSWAVYSLQKWRHWCMCSGTVCIQGW